MKLTIETYNSDCVGSSPVNNSYCDDIVNCSEGKAASWFVCAIRLFSVNKGDYQKRLYHFADSCRPIANLLRSIYVTRFLLELSGYRVGLSAMRCASCFGPGVSLRRV